MRFECDSCHAKYKISDEKVAGRVVRFPCRKCDHKIVIDGRNDDVTVPAGPAYAHEEITRKSQPAFPHEAATARARRPSSPMRRRASSVPPRRSSAVSRRLSSSPAATSALMGQHPGLASPIPRAKPASVEVPKVDLPEWHVSINDVPVGPIRLEELAHKIDAKAVSEYSLVWHEGFDDWRPLATVPELMSLLHECRRSGAPPRPSFSSMPPFIESRPPTAGASRPSTAGASRPAAMPGPPPPPPGPPAIPADVLPLADSLQPEDDISSGLNDLSQPPAALGPEDVFQSSPPMGGFSGFPTPPDDHVSVPSAPPQPAVVTEPRRGFSLAAWAVIVAVAVFSAVVAVLAFNKYGDFVFQELVVPMSSPAAVRPSPVAPVDTPPPVEETENAAQDELASETQGAEEGEEIEQVEAVEEEIEEGEVEKGPNLLELQKPADDQPAMGPARRRKAKRTSQVTKLNAEDDPSGIRKLGDDPLSAEDQKLLAEFGSSGEATPAEIDVKESGSTKSKRPPLDGYAVRATVATNKPRLQRCYERAVRGQQSPPSVRMDVSVTVAASGRVTSVNAAGGGPGGLKECIEASVRRWRFPASSDGGPAKFPIVFSAN